MDKTKICIKCKAEKPLKVEYFNIRKGSKDGFYGVCKVCRSENSKKYRAENKEQIQKYKEENKEYYQEYHKKYHVKNRDKLSKRAREHYEANKEHSLKVQKNYREENKEYSRKYGKEYREKNKGYFQRYNKAYYIENKERILRQVRLYQEENPHKYSEFRQRRRAREKKVLHTLTSEEWNRAKVYFNNSCSYCGMTEKEHIKEFNETLHQEHFIPLSRGGGYTHSNIIPACKVCNSSKYNSDFFEWYSTYEHYNKKRENKILKYLDYKYESVRQLSIL